MLLPAELEHLADQEVELNDPSGGPLAGQPSAGLVVGSQHCSLVGKWQALGSLHEAADRGLAVLVNHHNSRSGNVRGATAIEAEVDVILRLAKEVDPRRGETAETTTRRMVRGAGRFQEETPPALIVRLGRGQNGQPAHYEADAAGGGAQRAQEPRPAQPWGQRAPEPRAVKPPSALARLRGALEGSPGPGPAPERLARRPHGQTVWEHPQAHAIMQALTQAGAVGATVKTLRDTVGEPLASSPRKRATTYEWLGRLQATGAVRIVGQDPPATGGKPADVFAVAPPPWVLGAWGDGAPGLALVAEPAPTPAPSGGGRGEDAA